MLESTVQVRALPQANDTVVADGVSRDLGGPVLNIARHLAALGHSVRLGAVLGRWDRERLRARTRNRAIDTSAVAWSDGSSDLLFSFKAKEAYSAVYQRAKLPAALDEALRTASDGCEMLVLAGSRHERIRRLYIDIAAESRARWKVFTPNYSVYLYSRAELEELMKHVTFIAVNDAEAQYIATQLRMTAVQDLVARTYATLVVTHQGGGATLHSIDQSVSIPSTSGLEDDFIGAGDAFLAAFLSAQLSDRRTLESAYDGANLAAKFIRGEWRS